MVVLELTGKDYSEVGNFSGEEPILSPQFSKLNLTAAQILASANQEE